MEKLIIALFFFSTNSVLSQEFKISEFRELVKNKTKHQEVKIYYNPNEKILDFDNVLIPLEDCEIIYYTDAGFYHTVRFICKEGDCIKNNNTNGFQEKYQIITWSKEYSYDILEYFSRIRRK